MEKRLGPTFHRTFSLIRPGLSCILRTAALHGTCTKDLLRTGSSLGPEQINAMLRYAYGTRLIDADNRLTSLGTSIVHHDPNIESQQTLWILHYNLSFRQTLAPAFWPHVTTTLFRPESELANNTVRRAISDLYANDPEVKFTERSASDCATALLSTYSDDRSMGSLGILTQRAPGIYFVNEPPFPSPPAFAYLLANFWDSELSNTVSSHLSAVTDAMSPLLLTGSAVLKEALSELQTLHLVRVQQRTFPYQIEKLWSSTEALLLKVYE
jgi:hypothetical protein